MTLNEHQTWIAPQARTGAVEKGFEEYQHASGTQRAKELRNKLLKQEVNPAPRTLNPEPCTLNPEP